MPTATKIPVGSDLSQVVYGAAAFHEITRRTSWSNMLVGPSPKQSGAERQMRKNQSDPNYPIVEITDLTKMAGQECILDMWNIPQGIPRRNP